MAARSLLHRVEDLSNVDVDDANTQVIKSLPFTPHNQTSNQAIITNELLKQTDLLKYLVREYGTRGWEHIYDQAAIHICAKNIPHLSGRVLVQTSLRHLNDRDAIVKQARALALLFAEHGLPAYRFAIKVPFSGAGAAAAQQLTRDGISVLATAVFSLEQAIAASHAGCAFISPYYNEIAAHLDPSLRPNFEDPALEHPMSPRIIQILETFAKAYKETGKEQPVMVVASHFTNSEILAMTELKCQHITIPPRLLTTLLEAPDTLEPLTSPKKAFSYAEYETAERLAKLSATDPLAGPGWDGKLATLETDYIGHDGARLDTFIKSDPLVSKRLADAEAFFLEMEDKARIAIEKELAAQGF